MLARVVSAGFAVSLIELAAMLLDSTPAFARGVALIRAGWRLVAQLGANLSAWLPASFHRPLWPERPYDLLFYWAVAMLLGVLAVAVLVAPLHLLLGRSGRTRSAPSPWTLWLPPVAAAAVAGAPAVFLARRHLRYLWRDSTPGTLPWIAAGTGALLVLALLALVLRRGARRGDGLGAGGRSPAIVAMVLALALVGARSLLPQKDLRPDPPSEAANVLLISIDTLRADHLGAYGYARSTSPELDELASSGVLFESAFAPTSWTLPSHVTLFTGEEPAEHGVRTPTSRLPHAAVTLTEILSASGWATAGVVVGPFLNAYSGLGQGFDRYDDYTLLRRPEGSLRGSTARQTTEWAATWLRRWHRGAERTARTAAGERRPFFLFVHYWDVHHRYEPPAPWSERFDGDGHSATIPVRSEDPARARGLIDLYDGEIAHTDHRIGELLDLLAELGIAEDTLVVVTSDHGEELWFRGRQQHSSSLHREQVQVPLLLRWPGRLPAGLRIQRPVALSDVPFTVLDLLGVEAAALRRGGAADGPGTCGGHSLLPLVSDPTRAHRPARGTLRTGDRLSFRSDEWTFLVTEASGRGRREELYRRAEDPWELEDVASSHRDVLADFRSREAEWRSCWSDRSAGERSLDPEMERRLRALGYLE